MGQEFLQNEKCHKFQKNAAKITVKTRGIHSDHKFIENKNENEYTDLAAEKKRKIYYKDTAPAIFFVMECLLEFGTAG